MDSQELVSLTGPEIQKRVRALRRTDNVTNWFYLAREYLFLILVIAATIVFCEWLVERRHSLLWAVPVTLLAIMLVGAGQHRLATLTHEAAHYMLFRNRLLNELVPNGSACIPF